MDPLSNLNGSAQFRLRGTGMEPFEWVDVIKLPLLLIPLSKDYLYLIRLTIKCEIHRKNHRKMLSTFSKLRAYGTHSVLFLNIKSYAGGTRPWNRKNGNQVRP